MRRSESEREISRRESDEKKRAMIHERIEYLRQYGDKQIMEG